MKTKSTVATGIVYFHLAVVLGLLLAPRTGLSTSISCGQTITNATTLAVQTNTYSYAGTAGQVLSFAFSVGLVIGGMTADIYNPSGQWVTNLAGLNSGQAVKLTLASSGVYTILVHSAISGYAGNYSLSVQSVAGGGCNGSNIACGQRVVTNTSFATEMDAYGYVGTAGQMLSLAFSVGSVIDGMTADIYNPSGQWVTNLAGLNSGQAVKLTLASSGTYTILVHNSGYYTTGNYSLSVQSVTGGGCNGSNIACGQTIVTNTSFATEMDAYGYVGTAGQMLSFAFSVGLVIGGMTADIYNPSGQWVTNLAGLNSGQAVKLTLASSGTYTILVHNSSYYTTGNYSFSVSDCETVLSAPIWVFQPSNQVVSAGQGFTFTSSAAGFPFPAYQWQFSSNGVTYANINGATGTSYSLVSSGLTNIGYYRVVASNSQGTNNSTAVSLTFLNISMYAGLNIYGPIGANYVIQSTPALGTSNWTTLTNISLPSQPFIYIDYNSPMNSKQFYQAVPQ